MVIDLKKLAFRITLVIGTWIALRSRTWIGSWVGLEINLMSFIPLIINRNNIFNSEAGLKYFLIQAVASILLLTGISLSGIIGNIIFKGYYIGVEFFILIALLLKLGVAPFHSWFPEVSAGISWYINGILLTWQKLAPIGLLRSLIDKRIVFMNFFVIISIIVGGLGGLVQYSIKKIIAYSSINHIGWILIALKININLWLLYYIIYCLLRISIVVVFNKLNLNYLKQFVKIRNLRVRTLLIIFIGILSLGGLPPFIGFIPKWIVLDSIVLNSEIIMSFFIVLTTLISLFYYLRLRSILLILNNETSKNLNFINYVSSNNRIILGLKALIIGFNLSGLVISFWFLIN